MYGMNMNSGYSGWSMSNRAVVAYENGEKPISKFTKEDLYPLNKFLIDYGCSPINVTAMKKLLLLCGKSSWHHTGKYARNTNFYSVDTLIENLTDMFCGYADGCEQLRQYIDKIKKLEVASTKARKEEKFEYVIYNFDYLPKGRRHARYENSGSLRGVKRGNVIYELHPYIKNKKLANGINIRIEETFKKKPKDWDSNVVATVKSYFHTKKK